MVAGDAPNCQAFGSTEAKLARKSLSMVFRRTFFFTLFCGIVVTVTFLAGYFTHARPVSADPLPILNQAHDLLLKYGLNAPAEDRSLEYGMIRGMLQAYGDPYSSFAEPVQAELSSNTLQGSFGGIGVTLGKDTQGYHILFPIPDGPAAKAGILEGDRLAKVDDLEITPETSVETLMAAVRGPVGDRVNISVTRLPENQILDFSIKREEIAIPSVTWHLDPTEQRLGLIKVNLIASTTPDEIQKAISGLQERGATAFSLDLRDNYGGLLTSGVAVAQLFLKDGIVIEQQYKDQPVEQFKVDKKGAYSDIPLVVLVNQNTASAAEIISGALQAHKRARIIGVPTYGKNTIQLVFQLIDGSSMNVTAAHWWIPGLDTPRPGKGIQPDILLPDANGDPDPTIQAAIQALFPK
jgi:carboxyl-terminal processing protease